MSTNAFGFGEAHGDTAVAVAYFHLHRRSGDEFRVWRVTATRWDLVRDGTTWKVARRVNRLLDGSEEVRIPDIESKLTRFDDVVAPVRMALDQEKRVTDEINALFKLARGNDDFQAEQFMQWFVKEQVEEVATMTDLLTVIERSADSPLLVEEYLAREGLGEEGADPTAPPAICASSTPGTSTGSGRAGSSRTPSSAPTRSPRSGL